MAARRYVVQKTERIHKRPSHINIKTNVHKKYFEPKDNKRRKKERVMYIIYSADMFLLNLENAPTQKNTRILGVLFILL